MGITLRQCRQCGRLFQSWGQTLCPECVEYREKSFVLVRDYVYQHAHANLFEIAHDTGVEEPLILEFLKEERLSINDETALQCEKCGKPIAKGHYCDACRLFLEKMLYKDSQKTETKPKQIATPKSKDLASPLRRKERMHIDFKRK